MYNLESVFLNYLNFTISEVFHIKSASEENVFKIMKNIEIFKATSIHKVSGIFLKDGAKIVLKLINEICNLSISHGIFPNPCKIAKIKFIFKKYKKVDLSKGRPISLLALVLKIIEKLFHDQVNGFLSGNEILCHYQSGFRTKHSINLGLFFLTNN